MPQNQNELTRAKAAIDCGTRLANQKCQQVAGAGMGMILCAHAKHCQAFEEESNMSMRICEAFQTHQKVCKWYRSDMSHCRNEHGRLESTGFVQAPIQPWSWVELGCPRPLGIRQGQDHLTSLVLNCAEAKTRATEACEKCADTGPLL